jgi:P2 family phage contractile tail tube protein
MALPRILKLFNVFVDGVNYQGEVPQIQLPKLARKFDAYRSGGMPGEVKVDYGLQALELTVTYGGHMREAVRQFGIGRIDGVALRFAGSLQRDDTGATDAIEVVMRGRGEEIDRGDAKAGDKSEFKVKYALTYYKESINGETDIEIDLVNFIDSSGGIDRLEQHRRNLGL